MKQQRIQSQQHASTTQGPIVYWMSRDQRVQDNWALLHAQNLALQHKQPLIVVHNLVPSFLSGSERQLLFKLTGLQEVEQALAKKNMPFVLFSGTDSHKQLIQFVSRMQASAVVTDMSPLNIQRKWLKESIKALECRIDIVDAHNIIPVWHVSNKQEYAAYTMRPIIHKQLSEWLTDYPQLKKHPHSFKKKLSKNDWPDIPSRVEPYAFPSGEKAAHKALQQFIVERLDGYADSRNDPNAEVPSDLSPYFHYGQLSPQRAVYEVTKQQVRQNHIDAFIEEAVVRRELSDNFCFYNPNYDSFGGLPEWAQKTLNEHRGDAREHTYTRAQFEKAKTHDPLWNAAQMQMVQTGKMHGYMRMYWAKKILEWTPSPEIALKYAIYLNDKYELDGRDPNGYTGIAWSIGGLHDRAWAEREVFGKVRYMNFKGCKRKFDVQQYIDRFSGQASFML